MCTDNVIDISALKSQISSVYLSERRSMNELVPSFDRIPLNENVSENDELAAGQSTLHFRIILGKGDVVIELCIFQIST